MAICGKCGLESGNAAAGPDPSGPIITLTPRTRSVRLTKPRNPSVDKEEVRKYLGAEEVAVVDRAGSAFARVSLADHFRVILGDHDGRCLDNEAVAVDIALRSQLTVQQARSILSAHDGMCLDNAEEVTAVAAALAKGALYLRQRPPHCLAEAVPHDKD